MTAQQRRANNRMRDIPDYDDDSAANPEAMDYEDDVLRGRVAADISHAGEALTDEAATESTQSLLDELRAHHKCVLFLWGGEIPNECICLQ